MYTRKLNILVIDDDLETLETLKLQLSDIAFVTTATGGRQGLQCAREQKPDIILLDIEMPVYDGFRTLELLRNVEECINVPVIMLTGKSDKYSVINSITMGIDGYLIKPVSKKDLVDKIMEVYRKNPGQDERRTILAIDDDMVYLKQLHSLLCDEYNVIMINSTKLALEYLTNHSPDLILLDYQMPLYNGVTLINIIHQNANRKNIPFIILSGSLDQKAVQDFYPHSPVAYLAKPINKAALMEKIELALYQNYDEGD
ncbi:MAG: response regulator [Lachnospiraceae bacterium]|nr:response regulator [Lachnospiraceae bacterium]